VWLLLCAREDRSALWAASRLRARGLTPLEVLTPELLTYSFRWEHRLGGGRPPSVEFTLGDGRRVSGDDIRGVINRLPALPSQVVESMKPEDREYALQEWTALHISWLNGLQVPVINRPGLQGLCGAWRHPSEWIWLAGRAGLETSMCRLGTILPASSGNEIDPWLSGTMWDAARRATVLVLDGHPIEADVSSDTAEACGRLGVLSDTRLIGVDVDVRTGQFLDASPLPDLRRGDEVLVTALLDAMGGDV